MITTEYSVAGPAVTAQKSCEKSAPNSEARERREMAHMFYDLLHGKRKSIVTAFICSHSPNRKLSTS